MEDILKTSETFRGYKEKLKGRIYGVLCEKEKNGDWEKFLNSILIEVQAYAKELDSINYWALFGKLTALKFLNERSFRSTVFECMNIISGI
jgi:uncharacterized protein YgfB (UPF0149 family)